MLQHYKHRLKEVIELIIGRELLKELKVVVGDPDNITKLLNRKMFELKDILVHYNLIMRVGFQLDFTLSKPDAEIGLEYEYTWQVLLYKEVIKYFPVSFIMSLVSS